jgi:hypothetical protein
MLKVVSSCIGTKYTGRFGSLMAVSAGLGLVAGCDRAQQWLRSISVATAALCASLSCLCVRPLQDLALDAVLTVAGAAPSGASKGDIDIKNYAKVEKLPGGTIEECRVGACLGCL